MVTAKGKGEGAAGVKLGTLSAVMLFIISVYLFRDVLELILAKNLLTGWNAIIAAVLLILIFGSAVGFASYKTTLGYVVDNLSKLKVGDFAKSAPEIDAKISVEEARKKLPSLRDDFMVVKAAGAPTGVLTATDLAFKKGEKIEDVMTASIISVTEDADLRTALNLMQATGKTRIAVADKEGRIAKYLNMRDILKEV